MLTKTLDKKAIKEMARSYLNKHHPKVTVDIDDLAGACLFWQEQVPMGMKQFYLDN